MDEETMVKIGFIALILFFVLIIVISKHREKQGKNTRLPMYSDENMAKELERMEANRRRRTIVRTEIVTQGQVTKGGHGFAKAVVGAVIAGEVGATIGALSGKTRIQGRTTFRVWFQDGHDELKTVDDYSPQWREYLEYLPKS